MAKTFKSDKLIAVVKLRSMMPDHQNTFSDTDILDILNQEMDTALIPRVLSVHEEFYLVYEDITFVDGTSEYAIPYRAIGNKLREAVLVDSAGNYRELSRIEVDDLPDYQNGDYFTGFQNVFYMKNNFLVFPNGVSTPTGSSIRMYFYLRPNELVSNAEGAVISAIDRDTGIITFSNYPTAFTSATLMDFVGFRSPHKIYDYDINFGTTDSTALTMTFPVTKTFTTVSTTLEQITLTAHGYYTGMQLALSTAGTLPAGLAAQDYFVIKVDANTLSLATTAALATAGTAVDITDAGTGTHTLTPTLTHIPSALVVGDFVCLAEQTIAPQLVSDFHTVLAQRAALVCIESIGDEREVKIVKKKLDEMEKALTTLIDNRVEGAPQKFNARNSLLKQSRTRRLF